MFPLRHALAHALLKGEGKGVVAMIAALAGQLLNGEEMLGSDGLAVETDEMTDAQVVDVGIISDALHGKVFAEIGTVCANNLGQLRDVQVVLQVELRVHAVLLEQGGYLFIGGIRI